MALIQQIALQVASCEQYHLHLLAICGLFIAFRVCFCGSSFEFSRPQLANGEFVAVSGFSTLCCQVYTC